MNRGFYPQGKGKGKHSSQKPERTKGEGRSGEFKGRCMRCGKFGHKAQFCPQQGQRAKATGKGSGVGFVYTNWAEVTNAECTENVENPIYHQQQAENMKAIMDCGASESIVGAWTLQKLSEELENLGFNPEEEISLDTSLRKSFIFGNNETSLALGEASVNTGIHGVEQETRVHVVEGQTPLLLSSKWLYEQAAIIDFRTGQAILPKISHEVIQLERASTYHLLLPVTAYQGHDAARALTNVSDEKEESVLLRACAQVLKPSAPLKVSLQE